MYINRAASVFVRHTSKWSQNIKYYIFKKMMDGQIYDTKSIPSLKYIIYNNARLNWGSLSQLYMNGHPYNDYYSNHTISLPNCILYKKLTYYYFGF